MGTYAGRPKRQPKTEDTNVSENILNISTQFIKDFNTFIIKYVFISDESSSNDDDDDDDNPNNIIVIRFLFQLPSVDETRALVKTTVYIQLSLYNCANKIFS